MPDRWRSPAARELAKAVRAANGTIERTSSGKLRVTGPDGTITLSEPGGRLGRDPAPRELARLVQKRTGLKLDNPHGPERPKGSPQ